MSVASSTSARPVEKRGYEEVKQAALSEGIVPAPRGYFLAIAGNIGVGKTELTTRLSRELGWQAYFEPVIQNPYLDDFYKSMERWAFHLQIYFLSERFKAQVTIGGGGEAFIQDRTIYEDAEIFARVLHEQGDMSVVDYQNYTSLFHILVSFLRKPDLVLYLKARPETLLKRIATRGRDSEKGIDIGYLSRLGAAYDEWLDRARNEFDVMVVDTDEVALQGDVRAFHDLVTELKRRYPPQQPIPLPEAEKKP